MPLRLSAAGLAVADGFAVADGLAAAVVGLPEADGVADVADRVAAGVATGVAVGEFASVAAAGREVRLASGGATAQPPNASAPARAPIKRALDTPVTTNEGTRWPEPRRNQLGGRRQCPGR